VIEAVAATNDQPPTQTIVHVDINSYFATLLQQETPALRGKPVVIVKNVGRTCVIAASKEAKKLGIKTGCTVGDAHMLAPNVIEMPAEFDLYLSATRELKQLFESLSPQVEIFSLDESFIHFTPIRQLYLSPVAFGQHIQQKIKQRLGSWVTCNVGIAKNRFLAKLSSEVAAKGSVTQVTQDNQAALLASTTFDSVCGIGFRLGRRLEQIGVTVPYQINFLPDDLLFEQFGPYWSLELRKMGRGEEPALLDRAAEELPHMKSVGRSITGYKLCRNETVLKSTLYNLTAEVMYKVRKMKLAGRLVSIYLLGQDQSWGTHVTLQYYVRHTNEMFKVIWQQLYQRWPKNFAVIKLAVALHLLKPWTEVQDCWFPNWWKQERVATAVDSITQKYGLFKVTSGLLLNTQIIKPEVTGFLGDKKFQFA